LAQQSLISQAKSTSFGEENVTLLYAPAIQQAIQDGDLAKMKALADYASEHLSEWGDVQSALEGLKAEIARLENT
jgi:hypothetical protein